MKTIPVITLVDNRTHTSEMCVCVLMSVSLINRSVNKDNRYR